MCHLVDTRNARQLGLEVLLAPLEEVDPGRYRQPVILRPHRLLHAQRSVRESQNTAPDTLLRVVIEDLVGERPAGDATGAEDEGDLSAGHDIGFKQDYVGELRNTGNTPAFFLRRRLVEVCAKWKPFLLSHPIPASGVSFSEAKVADRNAAHDVQLGKYRAEASMPGTYMIVIVSEPQVLGSGCMCRLCRLSLPPKSCVGDSVTICALTVGVHSDY